MTSALFALMCVVVGSAATAREVRVALDNIRDGIRPSDDEVRKQWDIIITESRRRRAQAQEQLQGYRERWRNRGRRGGPRGLRYVSAAARRSSSARSTSLAVSSIARANASRASAARPARRISSARAACSGW